ncbi:MAG: glycosyltransferase family 9 protein [Candidatus Babeliales bacterium]|jgi:ADP-heptose:LPS heptosyltransferase
MQLIPEELLQRSTKVLFVAHLAIGDFTYLQNYLQAFAQRYQHLEIHIFVDELRRSYCFWRWKYLVRYALYDWLDTCPFIHKIYRNTYSPSGFRKSIEEAKKEQYPLVISLATLRADKYALLARQLSPQGFIVGVRPPVAFYQVVKRLNYRSLNQGFWWPDKKSLGHVTNQFAEYFESVLGVHVEPALRYPFIKIPNKWIVFAKLRFLKWGIDRKTKKFGRVIFINPFAKDKKRSWPTERVGDLIRMLKQQDEWGDVSFVVNVVPEKFRATKKYFDRLSLNDTFLCCADYNFFQLPSIMSQCDLVVSVETATMHLANAIKVPVVALMRLKNPEWAPFNSSLTTIVTVKHRREWINAITVDAVVQAVHTAVHAAQT